MLQSTPKPTQCSRKEGQDFDDVIDVNKLEKDSWVALKEEEAIFP